MPFDADEVPLRNWRRLRSARMISTVSATTHRLRQRVDDVLREVVLTHVVELLRATCECDEHQAFLAIFGCEVSQRWQAVQREHGGGRQLSAAFDSPR